MNTLKTKFDLSDVAFHQRLAETIAWCSAQGLIGDAEEDANTLQRREMSLRAAELLSLAYRIDPSLYEQKSWLSELMNRSKIRRASKMRAEAESLFATADPGSIDLPLRQQLRSSVFRSYASLFQLGENRTGAVEGLAEKRAFLLRETNTCPAAMSSDLGGGRLLIYVPDENVEDGASQYQTKGYFDEQDAPPWDTWICYLDLQLISWVPPSLLDLVQTGISVNPMDCIRWADDALLEKMTAAKSGA